MQGEELRGLAVVSVQQAEKLGTVEDMLVDVSNNRIAALLLQGGLFRGGPMVRWADIQSFGPDAVMVDESKAAIPVVTEDHEIRGAELRGMKVVGDNGELVGTLAEVDFDPDTGKVTAYVVTAVDSGGIFQHANRFPIQPDAVAAFGPKLVTVKAKMIDFQRTE